MLAIVQSGGAKTLDRSDQKTKALTIAGLNLIGQALSIYDSELRLAVSNQRFREMFYLPDHLVQPGARFEDTIRYIAQKGEYGALDDVSSFVDEWPVIRLCVLDQLQC